MTATQSIAVRSGGLGRGLVHASVLTFTGVVLLLTPLLTGAARGVTQVDCDTEDDFCTGDPVCTTSDKLEVIASPCTLDFGARTLVIAEPITIIPNGAQVSLTADAIEVRARVFGRQFGVGGQGAAISLITSGTISTFKQINVSASTVPGSILLQAGGNVEIKALLRAGGKGASGAATGGTITANAIGTVTSSRRGKLDARGKMGDTAGGQITLAGDAGVTLGGKIDVRGSGGGTVVISSTTGDVVVEQQVRVEGDPGAGGTILVSAADQFTLGRKAKNVANGKTSGGCIRLSGLNGVTLNSNLQARGFQSVGGIVVVASTSGDVVVEKKIRVNGDTTGGSIDLQGVNVTLRKTYEARGNPGGIIEAEATGTVDAGAAKFRAKTSGSVQLCGATVISTTKTDVPIGSTCIPGAPACP